MYAVEIFHLLKHTEYLDRRRQAGEGAGQDNVPGRIVSQGKNSQDAYGLVHEVKEGGGDITVAGAIFNFSKLAAVSSGGSEAISPQKISLIIRSTFLRSPFSAMEARTKMSVS